MDLYEVKISYNEYVGTKRKKMKRSYIVEAFNLTDLDAVVAETLEHESLEDVVISSTRLVSYNEIFKHEGETYYDDEAKWYKCKVLIGNLDDGKVTKNSMLVMGTSLSNAISELKGFMSDTVADWSSVSIEETNIYDIIRKH